MSKSQPDQLTPVILFSLLLGACAPDSSTAGARAGGNPAPPAAETPVAEPPASGIPAAVHRASAWVGVATSKAWTSLALTIVRDRWSQFEKARDIGSFCPGYHSATLIQKEVCWVRLIGAVVKFESGFRPATVFREPDGALSIGLMALTPGECKNAPTAALLKDPLRNLSCGIHRMAHLIARDGWVSGAAPKRGAGAYWSVLREPYRAGRYRLGKKIEIVKITSSYREAARG